MRNKLVTIVDELRTTIKQTFDDKSVTRAQVAHMVIISANKMLAAHIEGKESGKYLINYFVDVKQENNRKFIETPADFFDLDKDAGIEYISAYDQVGESNGDAPIYTIKKFQRVAPGVLEWISMNEFSAPSQKDPYFWVSGNKINLVGIESVPVKKAEIALYSPIKPIEEWDDLNVEFNFPVERLDDLKRRVVDMVRFNFIFKGDSSNDGKDTATDPGGQQLPKVASVNQQ